MLEARPPIIPFFRQILIQMYVLICLDVRLYTPACIANSARSIVKAILMDACANVPSFQVNRRRPPSLSQRCQPQGARIALELKKVFGARCAPDNLTVGAKVL